MDEADLLKRIAAFERQLDSAFDGLQTFTFDADKALQHSVNIYEFDAGLQKPRGMSILEDGLEILAPYLTSGAAGNDPDIETICKDLIFGMHYRSLRNYLYYSYNAPGAFTWTFRDKCIEIKFADPTIPRQFFTVYNDMLLNSKETFTNFTNDEEIRKLLTGQTEGAITPNVEKAWEFIAEEVELKLSAYFSILPMDADIDLGGYTYAQFIKFYRGLLGKALYHRYLTELNGEQGAVFIDEEELVSAAVMQSDLPPDAVRAALADIVFDKKAIESKVDASYFSLYREGGAGRIVMRPHHFAVSEGLVCLFRVIAQKRPQVFLERLSNVIGNRFVERAQAAWQAQGFTVRTNVSLDAFDKSLPDIDLLVISEEPTLGYVIFVCEVKSPIPPRWAKDHLRALNKDGVSKAFKQTAAIRKFLSTEDGLRFIESMLPDGGIEHFDEFVVVIDSLIITSDNAGMFFQDETTKIINFRTLERLLTRSDGDMAYIQHVLATYNDEADKIIRRTFNEVNLGAITVIYEGVTDSPILDFPQVEWRNSPNRQSMIDDFVRSGASPFDCLPVPQDLND